MPSSRFINFLNSPENSTIRVLYSHDITQDNAPTLVQAFKVNKTINHLYISIGSHVTDIQINCILDILAANQNIISLELKVQIREPAQAKRFFSFLNGSRQYKIASKNHWTLESLIAFKDVVSTSNAVYDISLSDPFAFGITNDKKLSVLTNFFQNSVTPTLTYLTLNYFYSVGNSIVDRLIPALKNNGTLTQIDLSHNLITDDGAIKFAQFLATNTTIKSFDIMHNKFSTIAISAFGFSLLTNNTLKYLNIFKWDTHLDKSSLSALTLGLRSNKTLKGINSDSSLTNLSYANYSNSEMQERTQFLLDVGTDDSNILCMGSFIYSQVPEGNSIYQNAIETVAQNTELLKAATGNNIADFVNKDACYLNLEGIKIGSSFSKLVDLLSFSRIKKLNLTNNALEDYVLTEDDPTIEPTNSAFDASIVENLPKMRNTAIMKGRVKPAQTTLPALLGIFASSKRTKISSLEDDATARFCVQD